VLEVVVLLEEVVFIVLLVVERVWLVEELKLSIQRVLLSD
jgi:hypothetical protein